MAPRKLKVAILGGGISGLTTAYELSRTPELRERFDVTVHQMGFRLGGKVASGRNLARGMRNEEHGLHVWFGFYENTFRMAREIYERWESPPDCPFRQVWDFVKPQRHTALGYAPDGTYRMVGVHFPRSSDVPGEGEPLPTPLGLVTGLLDIARAFGAFVASDGGRTVSGARARIRRLVWPEQGGPLWAGPGETDPALLQRLHRRLERLARFVSVGFTEMPLARRVELAKRTHELLSEAHPLVSSALERLTRGSPARRPFHQFFDITFAFLRGLTNPKDEIYVDGDLDRLNDRDFREWLIENGCSPESAHESPFLASTYDSSFQFLGSDRRRPAFEAGTAARFTIRSWLFYKHAPGYVVDAGMGEAVIAPLYEVLQQQGVHFELFHRLTRMELSPDRKRLQRLHFAQQARVKGGRYQPLFTHRGLRCWSSEPDWSQLERGSELRAAGVDFESRWSPPAEDVPLSLEAGVDFDVAVVALALGSIRPDADGNTPCREWLDAAPNIRAAAHGINLHTSVAAQFWFDWEMPDLGWAHRPAIVAWAPPLSIWCDMTPTLAHEGWGADAPQSVAYLCGVGAPGAEHASSSDRGAPSRARAEAVAAIVAQMETHGAAMWPGARDARGRFDWSVLHDPGGAEGPARLAAQYIRVNIEPHDLCDGAAPNNGALRVPAHESGLENVALAGTWTRTSLATSGIETGVMSGIAAARALGAEGRVIVAEGFMYRPSPPLRIRACEVAFAPSTSSELAATPRDAEVVTHAVV